MRLLNLVTSGCLTLSACGAGPELLPPPSGDPKASTSGVLNQTRDKCGEEVLDIMRHAEGVLRDGGASNDWCVRKASGLLVEGMVGDCDEVRARFEEFLCYCSPTAGGGRRTDGFNG